MTRISPCPKFCAFPLHSQCILPLAFIRSFITLPYHRASTVDYYNRIKNNGSDCEAAAAAYQKVGK